MELEHHWDAVFGWGLSHNASNFNVSYLSKTYTCNINSNNCHCNLFFTYLGDAPIQKRASTNHFEALQQRFISGFMLKSNQDRILMWETGILSIRDHFWLGIGYNNDGIVMPEYRKRISENYWSSIPQQCQHRSSQHLYSNVGKLWFFWHAGIPRYFLIFFLQTIRALLKTNNFTFENSILWAGISGVCGFMVAGLFENNFRDGEVQAMLMILIGLCFNQIQKLKSL